MEARQALFDIPRAFLGTSRPAPRANKNDVTRADLQSCSIFPGVQLFGINGGARLEVFDAPQMGNIDENSPSKDTALDVGNAQSIRPDLVCFLTCSVVFSVRYC